MSMMHHVRHNGLESAFRNFISLIFTCLLKSFKNLMYIIQVVVSVPSVANTVVVLLLLAGVD